MLELTPTPDRPLVERLVASLTALLALPAAPQPPAAPLSDLDALERAFHSAAAMEAA